MTSFFGAFFGWKLFSWRRCLGGDKTECAIWEREICLRTVFTENFLHFFPLILEPKTQTTFQLEKCTKKFTKNENIRVWRIKFYAHFGMWSKKKIIASWWLFS
jgi:hypothetical protein